MATEPEVKNWRDDVGRFSVECQLANYREAMRAEDGFMPPEQVHRTTVSGVVDTGATRLVLPPAAVVALGLPETGRISVRYADRRLETRATVANVQLEIQGRSGVFTAVVEPGRTTALIGAIVLEELDFIPDCTGQVLLPRDPNGLVAEIE